jgi:hypothetical protein
VVAWGHVRHGLFIGAREIIEPGHHLYGKGQSDENQTRER